MGIISAIGDTVEENLRSLMELKPGISRIENLDTVHKDVIRVGEIKKTNKELAKYLNLAENNNFTRTAMLGVIAARQAVENAGITDIDEWKTGLVSATSVGGMDTTEQYFTEYPQNEEIRRYILSHDPGDSTHKIADALGIRGFITTISTACSSAANAIMLGARLIQSGELDRVVVGGTDALARFTINGFKTLMILSDEENTPFDRDRKGLNLGEAAAYLVLESEEAIRAGNKKVLAWLSGFGNANDAYHQTASSENGEGATLAMQKALKMAGLSPGEISYINVHGTATGNNDLSEGRALINIFGHRVPVFSSTKPFTGHTLAAAGAIEAVYSILSLQHGTVWPNLNFRNPMPEFDLVPATSLQKKEIRHVLSNSFGFGGNCSTLLFTAADDLY